MRFTEKGVTQRVAMHSTDRAGVLCNRFRRFRDCSGRLFATLAPWHCHEN